MARTGRPVVYLADPDATYRTLLADALRLRAIDVVEFANGYDLCSACLPAPPDLVVMETGLEELSGFAVFTRLQRQLGSGRFRAVFLTAFDNPGVARVCKSRGVLDYLGKQHVTLQQMASTIEGLLSGDSKRETFRFGREAETGAARLTVLGPRIDEDPSVHSRVGPDPAAGDDGARGAAGVDEASAYALGDEAAAGVEGDPQAGGWISSKLRTLVGQAARKGRA